MSASGHSCRIFGIRTRSGLGRCTVQRVGAYTLAFPKRPPAETDGIPVVPHERHRTLQESRRFRAT